MDEIITNIHIHSRYTDGTGSHSEIIDTALNSGLDAIIITDHNVSVKDTARYHHKDYKKLLVLIGSEVNDQNLNPQKNHLLVLGIDQNLTPFASDPQRLIDQVAKLGGLCFIAHPFDPALKNLNLGEIIWTDWTVRGFTGMEIWNGMSEMKGKSQSRIKGLLYVIFPGFIAEKANTQALAQWDSLLSSGIKVVAIGGSDAHNFKARFGLFTLEILPYSYHFKTINNHLIAASLSGNAVEDSQMILDALHKGHSFISNDVLHPAHGFRFSAVSWGETAIMGDSLTLQTSVTFQIRLPIITECRLLHNGKLIKTWTDREFCTHITNQPGSYRVECYMNYRLARRAWIYSNPILVLPPPPKSKRS